MAAAFPSQTVPVTVDGETFVGELRDSLTTWAVYVFAQGFHLYLTPDEATSPEFLVGFIRAVRGSRWDPGSQPGPSRGPAT